MKVIIQRTGKANVKVDKQIIGQISHGLTALVGITEADEEKKMLKQWQISWYICVFLKITRIR